MRVVIQRVSEAHVTVESEVVGKIKQGYVLLVGFKANEEPTVLKKMVEKIIHLRLFEDQEGKLNESLLERQFEVLSISQFTLYADARKGRRPSFTKAASAHEAKQLYEVFNTLLKEWVHVETGIFQADMKVSLTNNGPVTVVLDSDEIF